MTVILTLGRRLMSPDQPGFHSERKKREKEGEGNEEKGEAEKEKGNSSIFKTNRI